MPVLILGAAAWAAAGQALTDQEKKRIVYRMYADYKTEFPAVKDVYPREAMTLFKQDAVIFVDIRTPAEKQVSMLPGAVSEEQFLRSLQSYSGQTVVAYCTISYRSGLFAQEMAEKGVSVSNLAGGILAWTLEGGKVYDGDGQVSQRLHVYGDKWDYAPAGYETVRFNLLQQIF
jgi:sodium/bile acid cotransporter 7